MEISKGYAFLIILVVALVTFITRIIPFIFFGDGKPTPKYVLYLGKGLPPAIMSMLIIYSLRNTRVITFPFGLSEVVAVVSVILLHIWKRNNLISILGGTGIYMLLIQYVFV